MNIKCPNCETAYVVPDAKVGDKPKKMRCSRCNEVFTVKRRDNETPEGYQEFTGQQEALPKEFAFLRVSRNAPPMATPSTAPAEPSEAPPKDIFEKAEKSSRFEDFVPEIENEKTQPGFGIGMHIHAAPSDASAGPARPIPLSAIQEQTSEDVPQPQPAVPAGAQPTAAGAPPAAMPAQQPGPYSDAMQPPAASVPQGASASQAIPASQPVHDIYGSASWENEAPLDLESYAVPSEKSQKIGKIVAISIGVVVLLMLFVMYRNGWSLSLSELPSQFAFAFSGGEREIFPDEVADLEATISERRLLSSGNKTYLLIGGTVFNNSPVKRSQIKLRGILIDGNRDERARVEAPCDIVLEDTVIKRTSPGQIGNHYRKRGKPHNCMIKGESSAVFQMVFENPPADYNPSSFTIDIIPVFAQ